MKIRYRILWFDDNQDWVESIVDDVTKIVQEQGFICERSEDDVLIIDSDDDFEGDYDNYDLILMDYDLGSKKGNEILKSIRNSEHYTEALFYSATEGGVDKLRSLIANDKIEGIYCSERETDSFLDKFEKIFLNSIKKFQDLNNLRGLVMAESADLDIKQKEIMHFILDQGSVDETFFQDEILSKTIDWCWEKFKSVKKYQNKIVNNFEEEDKEYSEQTPEKFIEDFSFDSDKKRIAMAKIVEKLKLKNKFDSDKYKEEILSKRNNLAHKKEIVTDGKVMYGEFEFNDESSKQLRKDIQKHKLALDKIYAEITSSK
jgi:CheY-like chemotaxis protein